MPTVFTPLQSLAGGALIGLAATLMMALLGRVAGVSGVVGGVFSRAAFAEGGWRVAFLAGMTAAALPYVLLAGGAPEIVVEAGKPTLLVGGLIVGAGVYFASGCTSGHGVCGLARVSPRSMAATLTFMASTALTVFVARHVLGG